MNYPTELCKPKDCDKCKLFSGDCDGLTPADTIAEIGRITREIKDLTILLNEKWEQYQAELDEGQAEDVP